MLVPPAQQVTTGVGGSSAPANLAMRGGSVKLVRVSSAIVKDPDALARTLQELASQQRDTAQIAASHPTASSMLIRNLTSVNGTFTVNHSLGRAFLGWFPARIRGAFVQIYEPTNQQGLDPTKQVLLHANAAGVVFDLLVY
jgi:hypothetical protein